MDVDSILSTDLSGIDISRPLIVKGVYELDVAEIKLVENKAKTGHNLQLTLKTAFEAKSTKGNTINPGFTITHMIGLNETEKYTKEMISQKLKVFRVAVTGQKDGSFQPLDQYLGKRVTANIDVESDATGEYGDKNVVKRFIEKK